MKRFAALLLVACLLTAMFPAAFAAQQKPEIKIQTAQLLDAVEGSYEPPVKGEKLNYFMPTFDMYGMTVVKGDTMTLSGMVYDGDRDEVKVGVMIYRGTYEELTEDSEIVGSAVTVGSNGYCYKERFYWDTTGMKSGDYTAIYFVTDWNDVIHYAAVCDLYISDREIPLEKLGIYVLELGKETEQVYIPDRGWDALSLGVVRYPYHTTDRREPIISGTGGHFSSGADSFPIGESFGPPDEPGEYLVKAWVRDDNRNPEFVAELKVIVEEDVGQFPVITPLDGTRLCFGQEKGFRIDLPQDTSMDDVLIHLTVDGLVEATRAEGNVLYLKGLRVASSWQHLIVAVGDRYVTRTFESVNHEDWTQRVSEPTCTESGTISHSCASCGLVWYEEIPRKGHRIAADAAVVVVKEPKATKSGISGRMCSVCKELVEFETECIFTDTQPDRFYSDALDYCYEKGIISGMTATTFGPTGTLNRAQLVSMLYRHAGSPAAEGENTFTDVPAESFYTAAVIWASENGIVYGYEDGSFRPGNSITRQELVAMLHRYMVRLDKDSGERSDLAAFEDLDQLMGYAEDAMQWAVANGVISGISATQLGPRQSANRAQTVTILHRIITGILGE